LQGFPKCRDADRCAQQLQRKVSRKDRSESMMHRCPGGRAPHLWLSPQQSICDLFGFEWTLLRHSDRADGRQIAAVAATLALDLKIVDLRLDEARDLYQADLVLIRPDQIVAWRDNSDDSATEILQRVSGRE
jgi:hypothetical protein